MRNMAPQSKDLSNSRTSDGLCELFERSFDCAPWGAPLRIRAITRADALRRNPRLKRDFVYAPRCFRIGASSRSTTGCNIASSRVSTSNRILASVPE
jgi:hypothetical protein